MSTTADDLIHTSSEPHADSGHQRSLSGLAQRSVMAAALAFSAYQLVVAAFHPLSSLVMRSLHVGFLMLLVFWVVPAFKRGSWMHRIPWFDWLLGAAAFGLGLYHWFFEADLIQRSGDPTLSDLWVGAAVVVLLFEAARRSLGLALPLVCAAFLLYGLFGQYLPDAISHRGYGLDQIIGQLYLGTEGIYGIPTLVSATYIFLFILFGAFLEHAGMIRLFNALALGLVGKARGGPAKVAVISSGLMGTISGSGVANVLTVGQFTIPLMKRFGYSPVFAGAVEATASMGGQIMPPVMGAVAFIMAETLNVPYADIVKAAVIPAVLYYLTAFWMVHLEAGRKKLLGLPADQIPNSWKALKENWHLALPLAALVWMLFHGFTPMFAGMMGLSLTAILLLGAAIAARISHTAFRMVFWFACGLGAAAFLQFGILPVLGVIAALVAINLVVKGGRQTLRVLRDSLIDGARQALPVGIACAIVGVIVGVLTLTGAATSFAGFIVDIGAHSLLLSLLLTMAVCLVLGMGIPTIPNYIITSSIAAPALLKLGVPLIVSHMFVFYFGIMADLTPPVALAAFAAASVAKASPMRIGFKATQIALAGFVVPYMAVYDPQLMLQGDWTWLGVAFVTAKAILAIVLWGAVAVGYLRGPMSVLERLLAFCAAALLITALPMTDEAGFALAAIVLLWHGLRARGLAAHAAT
ncbi:MULTISPECIES: TRAP transporter permease [unclassified Thiomonas]|uniref:TRAP transporter permease n=1 Tax=unclassified Thiomonas TaxID=2625466 RepID=UPI0004DBC939|nr:MULTISPECIES: TRAP transporter permease [unclassified Thiomonas]MDE2174698.1 TRAP transporter permease [Betaproteobacteria bacterium]CDW94640.1 TRAP transporter, 4TM/12TM fusion protein [Thiomonas sp. CB2]VDY04224.1 TRAP transporter, 4TM/12TM fusion protein [Thiomonas sp. Bio17B3]VDY08602.1 TRAP transporter, 4TM/12TM fusion protein [Thiomonas sp. Sup16B3]VDY12471.1 Putative TRAP C4-dicarboxylate transport system permease DctM subunit [Thiomonas sp. OC7]